MKKIKINWLQCFITAGITFVITVLYMNMCIKPVTRELEKVQYELQTVENQRNILSDIIRCHTDEEVENCDIMDVAKDFLPAIGCSKDSLAEWSYCY